MMSCNHTCEEVDLIMRTPGHTPTGTLVSGYLEQRVKGHKGGSRRGRRLKQSASFQVPDAHTACTATHNDTVASAYLREESVITCQTTGFQVRPVDYDCLSGPQSITGQYLAHSPWHLRSNSNNSPAFFHSNIKFSR